jgi:hypothetical protein
LDGIERLMVMSSIEPGALRAVHNLDDVFEFLSDQLDWPVITGSLDDLSFKFTAEELGIPADRLPQLDSLRQLRPLSVHQPWGVFFLEFSGPRLPVTPLRRLLQGLVAKKRAGAGGDRRTWDLDDLLFFITTDAGETVEVHLVAFFDDGGANPEIRSLPWRPNQSPELHIDRLATELLPSLGWPDDPEDAAHWRDQWRSAFKLRHGEAIKSAARLAERMADTATDLREQIASALGRESGSGVFSELLGEVRRQLVADVDHAAFADMCAQTLVYGVLSSRVTDPIGFGASPTLSSVPLSNEFLSAFFEQVHDQAVDLDLEGSGLEQLVADLRSTNVEAILDQFGSTARGGDPVIHFYEEFLTQYDRQLRADAGAFYTPQPVVEFMVRAVDEVLRTRFGLELGLADASTWAEVAEINGFGIPDDVDPDTAFVSMIDPATGTGTFLVEWLRQARRSFEAHGGKGAWADHLRDHVLPSMRAFELMLGPYAIAHLKVALELHADGLDGADIGILLTDTLDQLAAPTQLAIVEDPVSEEGERAKRVKNDPGITVCIGNPPYDRLARSAGGGWITDPPSGGRSLFDDLLDPAREHTIFSHHASLYNLYVYFWRWALSKVFEQDEPSPGVVCFITASSWLSGPGFLGLRSLARKHGDEIWVVDLGGDNKGARSEDNVFDIETPVSIVIITRSGVPEPERPARVRYRRVRGSRSEKFAELAAHGVESASWDDAGAEWFSPLVPDTGDEAWSDHPALIDLFPWQQPGCKFGRTWPIAASQRALTERWSHLVGIDDEAERGEAFITPSSGRNANSSVTGLPRIVDLPSDSPHQPIRRYGYRSFDRQWAFDDPRMAKTESPSLWASISDKQVFLATMPTKALGDGLAASVSAHVPDLHYFCGRGGKDIIPLFRDSDGTANADPQLLRYLTEAQRRADPSASSVSPERLMGYVYGVLAGANYSERFTVELEVPGPRVPLTADSTLFEEMSALGSQLLRLHTFGERFFEADDMADIPPIKGIVWDPEPSRIPADTRDFDYDHSSQVLRVADGRLCGVSQRVWGFKVSGMVVVKKWLGYRTLKGTGRAVSSNSALDAIRPTEWSAEWTRELLEVVSALQHTLNLQPGGIALLDRICEGPLIGASELPPVPDELRKPPKVARRASQPRLQSPGS